MLKRCFVINRVVTWGILRDERMPFAEENAANQRHDGRYKGVNLRLLFIERAVIASFKRH